MHTRVAFNYIMKSPKIQTLKKVDVVGHELPVRSAVQPETTAAPPRSPRQAPRISPMKSDSEWPLLLVRDWERENQRNRVESTRMRKHSGVDGAVCSAALNRALTRCTGVANCLSRSPCIPAILG